MPAESSGFAGQNFGFDFGFNFNVGGVFVDTIQPANDPWDLVSGWNSRQLIPISGNFWT